MTTPVTRLNAAAPELLSALINLVKVIDSTGGFRSTIGQVRVEIARAAIAKTTGAPNP